jgi:hypothetical protein
MKLLHLLFVCGLLTLAVPSQAAQQMPISRGGLGFLYADHNSFSNPGNFADDRGTGIQAEYSVQQQASGEPMEQTFIPSAVYGGTDWGFGIFGQRAGTNLLDSSTKTDTIGAGLGVGMFKDRLTIGVSGSRDIDVSQNNNGVVGGSITWNGNGLKREGLALGGAVFTTLDQAGGDVQNAVAAIGWGFEMTKIEAIATFNNLSDMSDWNLGAALTFEGKVFYFSALYNYLMLSKDSQLGGRLGIVIGKFDISALVSNTFNSTSNLSYGATVRIAF